jgi:hypothetical protein
LIGPQRRPYTQIRTLPIVDQLRDGRDAFLRLTARMEAGRGPVWTGRICSLETRKSFVVLFPVVIVPGLDNGGGVCAWKGMVCVNSTIPNCRNACCSYIRRMKNITVVLNRKLCCAVATMFGLSQLALASEPTALELIKQGNDYVGKDARDKVVQIRSEKSVGTLTPNIWYVVYYDVDATFKASEVKFGAGKKLTMTRPMRMLEMPNADKLLDPKKLKTDSDKAIKIATADPLLDKLTIRATQLWLDYSNNGPVWKVRLWASKLRNPNDMADIGDVYINAEDGEVTRRDLHINRVD